MLLQIVSDLHLEKMPPRFIPALADILVIAGDFVNAARVTEVLASYSYRWEHVIYVPGNHETTNLFLQPS